MRKIIVSEFVTIDNVMEGPGSMDTFKHAGWTMPYSTADIMQWKHAELFAAGALLLGRVTYEGFAAAWPTMEGTGDFGERMNTIPKFVVTKTLEHLTWNHSTLIKGDVVAEILKLKQEDGQDILVFGSSELAHTLAQNNLVDEYRLLVYPVVLGEGKRLFKDGDNLKLSLVEEKKYESGVVLLRYVPVRA